MIWLVVLIGLTIASGTVVGRKLVVDQFVWFWEVKFL